MDTVTIPEVNSPMAEKVSFGAREMDRVRPDWHKDIDTSHLNMAHVDFCIAGQVFGDFEYCNEELGWDDHATCVRGLDLFFDGDSLHGTYAELDELWKAEISTRLNADKENSS